MITETLKERCPYEKARELPLSKLQERREELLFKIRRIKAKPGWNRARAVFDDLFELLVMDEPSALAQLRKRKWVDLISICGLAASEIALVQEMEGEIEDTIAPLITEKTTRSN